MIGGGKILITREQEQRVREYLLHRKCYDFIVKKGIFGLLKQWAEIVKECEQGYTLTINDFLNDLATRDLILDIIKSQKEDQSFVENVTSYIHHFDQNFKKLLIETDKCSWGSANAKDFPKKKYWWYWGMIKNAKGQLLDDLRHSEFLYYRKKK